MDNPSVAPVEHSVLIRKTPLFFGWAVVAAGMIGMAMTIPGQTAGVSLFIEALIDDLGLSRSAVSLAYTIATIAGAATLPFVGRGIDRYGPRAAVVAITLLFALTCAGMSLVNGLIGLFVGFVLLRALGPGSLSLASLHVVNLWFIRRRGLAVGCLGVGIALATAIFPPLIERLIASVGWRLSFLYVGFGLLVIMLPVGALFFRGKPEQFGLTPDGDPVSSSAEASLSETSYTLPEARRTLAFWLFTIGGVCMGMLGTALLFHHFALMEANGIGRTAAAVMFIPLGVSTAAANLGTGFLMDRLPPRALLTAMLLVLCATLGLASFVDDSLLIWLYGGLFGLAQGMQSAITGSAYAYYFGRMYLGAIKGFTKTIFVGGTAFGPFLLALGMEHLGARLTLFLLALLPLSLACLAAWALQREDRLQAAASA